jgi:hypothetical protein
MPATVGLTAMGTSAQPSSQSVAALTAFIVLFFLFTAHPTAQGLQRLRVSDNRRFWSSAGAPRRDFFISSRQTVFTTGHLPS